MHIFCGELLFQVTSVIVSVEYQPLKIFLRGL